MADRKQKRDFILSGFLLGGAFSLGVILSNIAVTPKDVRGEVESRLQVTPREVRDSVLTELQMLRGDINEIKVLVKEFVEDQSSDGP